MKRTIKITILILLVSKLSIAQQEPHYTQNQFNSNLIINPAYAGSSENPSVGLLYRNQWTGLEGAPVTMGLIGETRVLSDRLGIGIDIDRDVLGIDRTLSGDLNIAYHLPVGKKGKFALGFKGGVGLVKSDFSKLTNINPGDPLYNTVQNISIPYIGVGALYYTDKFYIGLSSPRLISFENAALRGSIIEPHYYLYGGCRIILDDDFELRPALLMEYQPKAPVEFDLATDLWFKSMIGFGLAYRTNDAVNFLVKMKYKGLYLGYSYDMTVSGLRNFNAGTHEIFIGFEFGKKRDNEDPTRNNDIRYF